MFDLVWFSEMKIISPQSKTYENAFLQNYENLEIILEYKFNIIKNISKQP